MIMNNNYFKDKNLGIAVERLAELSSVSLGEELAGRHVRVCVRVSNVFPPVFVSGLSWPQDYWLQRLATAHLNVWKNAGAPWLFMPLSMAATASSPSTFLISESEPER